MQFDAFAQRLLQLLDEGRFVATYKFAVLLGLLEVLTENTGRKGRPPDTIATRALAEAVVEIYWPHTRPFGRKGTLCQNQSGQAEIVTLIARFREHTIGDASLPIGRARWQAPEAFVKLVRAVEWKLIEMPLGKLQLIGNQYDPFIYRLDWDQPPRQAVVKSDEFDGRLLLAPGAGEHLLGSAPLLRPLVQRTWALTVSRFNKLPDAKLDEFLFGAKRISLASVTPPLRELAGGSCFYCGTPVKQGGQVDHFIPWARHIDNGIHNLVYSHGACNGAKSAFFASERHAERWLQRASDSGHALSKIASDHHWDADRDKTLAAARTLYLRLPDSYKLWVAGKQFESANTTRLNALFASA